MAPKAKKVTMSLNDFLNTNQVKEIGGDESWADEGFSLPSAPRGMGELPSGPSGAGNDAGGFGRRPGRFSEGGQGGHGQATGGPVTIDQSRLPTCAPFTAFIGNLPFDVAEVDVRTFFQMRNINASAILNVKLPRDVVENKSRGFGYVEFATVEDLTRALMASNQFSIRNRVVRVDMSDSKPQNDREMRPAEANRNWRDSPAGAPRMAPAGHRGMEHREERPLSVAETSRNWRDGAKPIEKTTTSFAPRAIDGEERRSAPRPTAPVAAAEPVRNWRESAKPVERTAQPVASAAVIEEQKEKKTARPAPEPSKVPAGSWRR